MVAPKKSILTTLAIGTQGEKLLQSLLEKAGISSILNPAKKMKEKKGWDLLATLSNGEAVTFEVKYDLYAARSGNIAIEFFNSKSSTPSGLTATTADIWCHIITNPNSIWLTDVKSLKEFCQNTKPLRTITAGGDDNSCMYLYKQNLILEEVFTRIDDCDNKETLQNLIKLFKETHVQAI